MIRSFVYLNFERNFVAAFRLPDFNGSSDLSVAQSLLQAYDNYDREAFKAITGGSFIRQMDPVVSQKKVTTCVLQ